MIYLREMIKEDIRQILDWNEPTKEFLTQWSNFTYPLTEEQYVERMESMDFKVFAIEQDDTLIGTVQIFSIDYTNKTAYIGCYLLNPNLRGQGLGADALKQLTEYAFSDLELEKVILAVWDYNIGAQKCYEKVGFVKFGEYTHSSGWVGYRMALYKTHQNAEK